jgi:class 3 adenylate cyclase/tetratricopeptide (TPR) repeat protein
MTCGNPLPVPGREATKVVTIVFTDLVDSVGLGEGRDPGVVRKVMTSFFDTARQVFERYDGTVQKFVGDAIVAVFGVPVLHEDDPYRAVKAAYSLHAELPRLNARLERDYGVTLRLHTGINTGEATIDEPLAYYPVVLGDVVNVAARLGKEAGEGQIYITDATYRMVRDATEVDRLRSPIKLDGRHQPAVAWQLLAVHDHRARSAGGRSASSLVGRKRDLQQLDFQYEGVEEQGRCQLVVVRGDAGVGKTRLVEEFTQAVRRRNATVLNLRCLPPHGGQVASWPIKELLRQAARAPQTDPPERIRERLAEIVGDERVMAHVAAMLGLAPSIGSADEVNRALHQVVELLARSGTVVVVVDDLHYAEQSLLGLIEHIAGSPRHSPILLLCVSRLEFFERDQPGSGWATSLSNQIPLRPLSADDTERLVANLLSEGEVDSRVSAHIVQAAEGNPLFVEELITMLTEHGALRLGDNRRWEAATDLEASGTPMHIRQVLGARLDRLDDMERAAIDAAAVIGRQFAAVEVAALVPSVDEQGAGKILAELARKELLLLATPLDDRIESGGERFRFRHGLIQEVTHRTIAKETRAELHEAFATWLEQASRPDRTIALHLEKAYEYRVDLGGDNETVRGLAQRAGERLAAAGRSSARGGEPPAHAAALLTRAVELLPESHPGRLAAYLDLAEVLRDSDLESAIEMYDRVATMADAAGDDGAAMHAALGRLEVQWYNGLRSDWDEGRADIDNAVKMFSGLNDNLGLAKARRLLANMYAAKGESTVAREKAEEAIRYVELVPGADRLQAQIRRLYGVILFWGPAPLDEVVEESERAVQWARSRGMYSLEAGALSLLARAAAMRGDFDAARHLNEEARSAVGEDEGELLTAASDSISQGLVELLAEDFPAAERALRRGYEALERRHATASRANVAALLARALLRLGRDVEAEHFTQICEQLAAKGQLDTRIKWRGIRAIVLARRGELQEAESLARAAVELAQGSEQLDSQAEAFADLAQVLRATDAPAKHDEAAGLVRRAAGLYRRKGNVVAERRLLASTEALTP